MWQALASVALDAPLIAGAWAWALAVAAGVPLNVPTLIGLLMAAWWVYAADRLADVRHLTGPAGPRHRTLGAHPRVTTALLTAAALVLAGLAFLVPRSALLLAAGIAALGAVGWWLGRTGVNARQADVRAALLAGGFALAAWLPGGLSANLPVAEVALTLLPWTVVLWFNVRLTEWWERHEDDGRPAAAAPPAGVQRGGLLTAGVLLAGWAAAGTVGSAQALAALPAWWVHWQLSGHAATGSSKRGLADAALLLPAVILVILHTI